MKKVIMFPTLKEETFIEEANEAFYDAEYEAAIPLYEKLFLLDITSIDLHWNYLVSLRNNNQLKDAVEYAKEFSEYYIGREQFYIVEFAISIMLEDEDYLQTALFIHEMLHLDLDKDCRQQILTILSIIDEQNRISHNESLNDLHEAIQQEDHQKSWFCLEKIHFSYVQINPTLLTYLKDPKVHPVVKTKVLELFIYHNYTDSITIEKFGNELSVIPNELQLPNKAQLVKELIQSMNSIEQNNPSLFEIIKEMVNQYVYVMYPFQNDEVEISSLREAFIIVGKKHLSPIMQMKQIDEETTTHIYNIETCLQLYSSISASII